MPEQSPTENEMSIDWEQVHQKFITILEGCATASGEKFDQQFIGGANTNNFHEYFPEPDSVRETFEEYIKKNEAITRRQSLGRYVREEASGPKDFFTKNTKKCLDITLKEFLKDIDDALKLVGITEDDLKNKTYLFDKAPSKEVYEAKHTLVQKALEYLIVEKGY